MTGPFVDAATSMRKGAAVGDWSDPFPVREGCSIEPLIEAADMFPRLEQLCLSAKRSIWLSFRIFDPATKLRSDEAKAAGLSTWAELIRHVVEQGVEVRVLLADFEPILADYLHAGSWQSFCRLREVVDSLGEDAAKRLQTVVIQHEGEIGWLWRQLLRLHLRARSRKLVRRLLGKGGDGDPGLAVRPGLWRYCSWEGDRPTGWKPAPPPRLWPATYHQKFVVIDGESLVVGGLDLDERRWDDERHRQRANQTWHDISCLVRGPAVADAARHFASLWNAETPRFRQIAQEWMNGAPSPFVLEPLTELDLPDPEALAPAGEASVQMLRTRSRRSRSPVAMGPIPHVRELKAAHRALIGSASERLYIEAQFFRSLTAADWVVRALRAKPGLEVIILVANVPEEIAFEGQKNNPAHRHGEYLQARALRRILHAGGPDRVGLFTLAKQEEVRPDEKKFEKDRGTAFGAGVIHIHAKLLIADDCCCLLSSANINGRSFEWDTEFGLVWSEEREVIGRFREELWGQLFAGALKPDARLADWRELATANSLAEPEDRKGFVVPYQLGRARRFARPYWFVPDDLV